MNLNNNWNLMEEFDFPEVNFHNFKRMSTFAKDIKKTEMAGFLNITFLRLGKQNVKKIPIFYEERNCTKNQE